MSGINFAYAQTVLSNGLHTLEAGARQAANALNRGGVRFGEEVQKLDAKFQRRVSYYLNDAANPKVDRQLKIATRVAATLFATSLLALGTYLMSPTTKTPEDPSIPAPTGGDAGPGADTPVPTPTSEQPTPVPLQDPAPLNSRRTETSSIFAADFNQDNQSEFNPAPLTDKNVLFIFSSRASFPSRNSVVGEIRNNTSPLLSPQEGTEQADYSKNSLYSPFELREDGPCPRDGGELSSSIPSDTAAVAVLSEKTIAELATKAQNQAKVTFNSAKQNLAAESSTSPAPQPCPAPQPMSYVNQTPAITQTGSLPTVQDVVDTVYSFATPSWLYLGSIYESTGLKTAVDYAWTPAKYGAIVLGIYRFRGYLSSENIKRLLALGTVAQTTTNLRAVQQNQHDNGNGKGSKSKRKGSKPPRAPENPHIAGRGPYCAESGTPLKQIRNENGLWTRHRGLTQRYAEAAVQVEPQQVQQLPQAINRYLVAFEAQNDQLGAARVAAMQHLRLHPEDANVVEVNLGAGNWQLLEYDGNAAFIDEIRGHLELAIQAARPQQELPARRELPQAVMNLLGRVNVRGRQHRTVGVGSPVLRDAIDHLNVIGGYIYVQVGDQWLKLHDLLLENGFEVDATLHGRLDKLRGVISEAKRAPAPAPANKPKRKKDRRAKGPRNDAGSPSEEQRARARASSSFSTAAAAAPAQPQRRDLVRDGVHRYLAAEHFNGGADGRDIQEARNYFILNGQGQIEVQAPNGNWQPLRAVLEVYGNRWSDENKVAKLEGKIKEMLAPH